VQWYEYKRLNQTMFGSMLEHVSE